jgi:hypothetical protein
MTYCCDIRGSDPDTRNPNYAMYDRAVRLDAKIKETTDVAMPWSKLDGRCLPGCRNASVVRVHPQAADSASLNLASVFSKSRQEADGPFPANVGRLSTLSERDEVGKTEG